MFGFLLGFVFAGQTWRVWRSTGRNPLRAFVQGTVQERLASVGAFGYPALLFGYAMWPHGFAWSPVIAHADVLVLKLLGALAMAAGLATVLIAYASLGEAWRVGIDPDDTPKLIERGIYRQVRHPVYGGLMLLSLGVFAVVPNGLFFLCWALHVAGGLHQASREEAFLTERFGDAYRAYCSRTWRFWPLV